MRHIGGQVSHVTSRVLALGHDKEWGLRYV